MQKDMKDCENPDCTARFIPYSSRQRVCKKESCKVWLMNQNFQKARYRFTNEYLDSLPKDIRSLDDTRLTFTRDDIEKVEE